MQIVQVAAVQIAVFVKSATRACLSAAQGKPSCLDWELRHLSQRGSRVEHCYPGMQERGRTGKKGKASQKEHSTASLSPGHVSNLQRVNIEHFDPWHLPGQYSLDLMQLPCRAAADVLLTAHTSCNPPWLVLQQLQLCGQPMTAGKLSDLLAKLQEPERQMRSSLPPSTVRALALKLAGSSIKSDKKPGSVAQPTSLSDSRGNSATLLEVAANSAAAPPQQQQQPLSSASVARVLEAMKRNDLTLHWKVCCNVALMGQAAGTAVVNLLAVSCAA